MTQPTHLDLDALQAAAEAARKDTDGWEEQGYQGPWQTMREQSDAIDHLIDRLRKVEAVREGWKLVPIEAQDSVIVAIENEIDSQLTASAMNPGDMFRQDGQYVWDAAIAAAPDSTPTADKENGNG